MMLVIIYDCNVCLIQATDPFFCRYSIFLIPRYWQTLQFIFFYLFLIAMMPLAYQKHPPHPAEPYFTISLQPDPFNTGISLFCNCQLMKSALAYTCLSILHSDDVIGISEASSAHAVPYFMISLQPNPFPVGIPLFQLNTIGK